MSVHHRIPTIRHSGFSLIELLVAIGIIGVLAGLTVPAVQAAREAARRATCNSNLRQIGIAVVGYHDLYGCNPICVTNSSPSYAYSGYYAIHARILPFLDQRVLYDSINFSSGTIPYETLHISPVILASLNADAINASNSTAIHTRIGIFICPSDSSAMNAAENNYRANIGVGPNVQTSVEFPDSDNGFFSELGLTNAARMRDGLSHTVAFSERFVGTGLAATSFNARDSFASATFVRTADDLIKACRIVARPDNPDTFAYNGKWWFWTGRERTLYNHAQPPNGRTPDCIHGSQYTATGMATARSWHPGGVHTLMGDGSVRFISESVAVPVWRAFGTRNGGEIVD